ncbi:MAG: isochorismatase family protein [Tissierellia bacterium]|nr:isochorismatase family protein [Tissierellia bacterium]
MTHKLKREDCLFLFIDIQDSLARAMSGGQEAIKQAEILAKTAEIMDIDTIFTTQYKKGLGDFTESIRQERSRAIDFDKAAFSAMLEEDFVKILEETGKNTLVVSGMETHICCLFTVRDLLEAGKKVVVAFDAMASRNPENKAYALEEMRDMGATIRSTESILFDLNSVSGTPEFKAVQKLIK